MGCIQWELSRAAGPAFRHAFGLDPVCCLNQRENALTLGNARLPSSLHGPPAIGAFTVAGHAAPWLGMGSFAGFDALPIPSWMKRRLARAHMIFGVGVDSGRASVEFRGGALSVNYDAAKEPIYDDIRAALRVLKWEHGGRLRPPKKPLTVHRWGGACLGASERDGVVDHRGEVYGNPGLFVTDGLALPAAPGGPPSLAVAAWAHHVADGLGRAT